ncbi:MAG: hypothetical protein RBU30_10670 [Polyangia bacterium]|jgi:hypothetical protein|nr:hypothetical protein [Polyangia bacterium]
MASILSLKRNDVQGALTYAEERLRAGEYTSDDSEQLFMLQDDPEELLDKLDALLEKHDWSE